MFHVLFACFSWFRILFLLLFVGWDAVVMALRAYFAHWWLFVCYFYVCVLWFFVLGGCCLLCLCFILCSFVLIVFGFNNCCVACYLVVCLGVIVTLVVLYVHSLIVTFILPLELTFTISLLICYLFWVVSLFFGFGGMCCHLVCFDCWFDVSCAF